MLSEGASAPTSKARVLLWVGTAAVVVRLFYLAEHSTSAFFSVPVLDAKHYDSAARALLAGSDPAGLLSGFRPLLYPLFLAGVYALAGEGGMPAAIALQHLLGVATALLVAWLAARLYGRPLAGAVAGGLYVLAGPPLYFEGELLITALFTFLAMAAVCLFAAETGVGRRAWPWLAAGAVAGLAVEARANAVLFLLAWPLCLLLAPRDERRRRAGRLGLALGAALVVVLGFAAWRSQLAGHFHLLPSAGGVNLYLGNKRGADGMIPRQDRPVTYGEEYRDSVEVFAEEVYREQAMREGGAEADPRAVSRFWLRRTVAEITAAPGEWLALMGRKVWLLAWSSEVPNNKSYAFTTAHESRLLGWLPVRWWLLFALAPLGALFAWTRADRGVFCWLAAFLASHAAGVLLFFVNARYRLPLWPGMAVLAAGGLLALGALAFDAPARERRWSRLGTALAVCGLLGVFSLLPPPGVELPSFGRDFFFRSIARLEVGHLEGALEDARRSVELDPSDPAARFQLGNVALALGDTRAALESFEGVLAVRPDEPRVWNNLGVALEHEGDADAAYRVYLRALEAAGDYAPALTNAALLELRRGELETAEARLLRAGELGFRSPQWLLARAYLAELRGDEGTAAALLAEATAEAPEAAELWQELHEPLAVPGRRP